MKPLFLSLLALIPTLSLFAQPSAVPTRQSEDTKGIMAPGYWARWDDAQQARIDADIEAYRKADASFRTGKIKKGTVVKVEQIASEFVFGASAFNWNQLGTPKANARYRELFGTLFNRATVPFYWKDFEMNPGAPRYKESIVDREEFWNKIAKPKLEPRWRRPVTDPIVDWCTSHGVAVHGHPLVWGSRKWQYPRWMQYDGVPVAEQRALDSLEVMYFSSAAAHAPSYDKMSPEEIASILPVYLKNQEMRTLARIRDIMTRYKGRIGSWDVVNESARDYIKGVNGPGQAMSKSNYGPTFADYTFRSFKEAERYDDENTLLNINDYEFSEGYLKQVKDLVARGARIEVIGSQMHLFDPKQCADLAAGKEVSAKADPEKIRSFFSMLGSAGIPTCLSEITITSAGEGEKGEMIQAIIARNLYRLWFSLPSMMGITWWNIVDDCGAPGEPVISGLFHRDMTPKTAYFALDQLINHEWRTNLDLTPDRKGNISWRGFKGTYRITWTDAKGAVHTEEVCVR